MNNLSVLIAGTSASYLEISKKMLKFHYNDCEVDFAYSGHECIDKISKNDYRLALFDYDLGDINGLDVINAVKSKAKEVSLVMLVDEGEDEIALQSIERGAADYILKVRGYLTALPITIRNILQKKQLSNTQKSVTRKAELVHDSNRQRGDFILDSRGRILSANSDLTQITDYSEAELQELCLFDLLPSENEKPFHDWLNSINENGNSNQSFRTDLVGKTGNKISLKIRLTSIRDENQQVVNYRGHIEFNYAGARSSTTTHSALDQLNMINQVSEAIISSHYHPFNVLLERLAEIVCQVFRFRRSTIALLDAKRKAFIKQSMIGYVPSPKGEARNLEVPQEVIQRIFADRYRVKVIYYDQVHRDSANYINSKFPERRTQKRRLPAQWNRRDLILVNLSDRRGNTFGYISLDYPLDDDIPSHNTFHNLQLFGQLVAMAIENYYQFSAVEKRSRRLKQILVTSNIFKLYLSLSDLLKEVVWSIKFSLNYNFVSLGLISKKSASLEIKAIACDDKIKQNHLLNVQLPLEPLSRLFRSEYSQGKSYFISRGEEVLRSIKEIYRGPLDGGAETGAWPIWGMLLVPVKSREGKVIGVLMVDDPEDNRLPSRELISTLEILANQVAVAIDNRIVYVQAKKKIRELETRRFDQSRVQLDDETASGIKGFVDRLFN